MRLLSVEVDGKCLIREHDVLEALHRHFVTVGAKVAKKSVSGLDDKCLQNIKAEKKVIKFKTVDNSFIMNATGSDKVPTKVSKMLMTLCQSFC